MTKIQTTLLSALPLFAIAFAGWIPTANALQLPGVTDATYDIEVRTTADCDDEDERCEPGRASEPSVARELNKTTPVVAPTNICDGVTCADGSCVATPDMCSSEASQQRTPIREGGQTIDAGTIPEASRNIQDTDSDGAPDVRDEDSDDDGLPTLSRPTDTTDRTTPLLWQRYRANQNTQDIQGTEESALVAGFMKFDDINGEVNEDAETGELRLSRVAIAARDLRNWTSEDREAFMRLREAVDNNTPEAASMRITEQALADNRIETIEATETSANIEYRTTMRVLGFIPIERTVTARAHVDGSVEIDYPWYRILATTPDSSRINTLLQNTLAIINEVN